MMKMALCPGRSTAKRQRKQQVGEVGRKLEEIHVRLASLLGLPIGSMYGIFTYIYNKNQPNVGKYTIHGSYGLWLVSLNKAGY